MVIITAGMPRAGNSWYAPLIESLLSVSEPRASDRRQLLGSGCPDQPGCVERTQLSDLSAQSLQAVMEGSWPHGISQASSLAAPTRAVVDGIAQGRLRVTYLDRDPRDVVLSSLEYGGFLRATGKPDRVYAPVRALSQAVDLWAIYMDDVWSRWRAVPGVHFVRYGDMIRDPRATLRGLADHLGREIDDAGIEIALAWAEERSRLAQEHQRRISPPRDAGRFRLVMNEAEQHHCLAAFREHLIAGEYSLEVEVDPGALGLDRHLEVFEAIHRHRFQRRVEREAAVQHTLQLVAAG